jgi:putative membrane protein
MVGRSMGARCLRRLSAALVALSVLGCAEGDDAVPDPGPAVAGDAQVLEAARVLEQGVMEAVLAVRGKFDDPEVVTFAGDVLEDHRAARERAIVLARRLDLELEPSPLSRQLEREAAERLAAYAEQRGDVLEWEWLGDLIELDAEAAHLVDGRLLPAASAPEVRELLQDMRRMIADEALRGDEVRARQGRF